MGGYSATACLLIYSASILATYDSTGAADYLDVFSKSEDDYEALTVEGGVYLSLLRPDYILMLIRWPSG